MTRLMTTGYQGETIDHFVTKLVAAGVDLLVDVRTLPLSRKPGFSKSTLQARLAEMGIDYVHMPGLGMPRPLLRMRRSLTDNTPILDQYEQLLDTRLFLVMELLELVRGKRACLMCFESDEAQCHRSRLARFIATHCPEVEIIPV